MLQPVVEQSQAGTRIEIFNHASFSTEVGNQYLNAGFAVINNGNPLQSQK